MRNRFVIAGLIAVALASSGCTAHSKTLPQKTAKITIDGNTRTSHAVHCSQVQSLLTVEISAAPGHVRMLLRLDADKPVPETVNIDNVNGFTGVASGGVGKAQAVFRDSTYTVTGTAQGPNLKHPDTQKTASFQIEAEC